MALRHAITTRLSVAQESIVAPVVIVLSSTSTIEGSILHLLNLVEIFYPSHSVPQISNVLNCLAGSATGTEEQYSLEAHVRLKMWRPAGITEEMIGKKGAPEVLYIPFAYRGMCGADRQIPWARTAPNFTPPAHIPSQH